MDDNPFASPEAPQTSQRREPKRWLGQLFLAVGFACNAFIMAGVNLGAAAWDERVGIGLLVVTLICIVGSARVYWQ